jgi:hypothetical protein
MAKKSHADFVRGRAIVRWCVECVGGEVWGGSAVPLGSHRTSESLVKRNAGK